MEHTRSPAAPVRHATVSTGIKKLRSRDMMRCKHAMTVHACCALICCSHTRAHGLSLVINAKMATVRATLLQQICVCATHSNLALYDKRHMIGVPDERRVVRHQHNSSVTRRQQGTQCRHYNGLTLRVKR